MNCRSDSWYTRLMDTKAKKVRNFVAIAMEKRWGKKSNVHRHRADRRPKDARRHWSREEGLQRCANVSQSADRSSVLTLIAQFTGTMRRNAIERWIHGSMSFTRRLGLSAIFSRHEL